AVEMPGSWLVAEVTTSRLRRETAAAVDESALCADVDKLVEEVEQIDAAISALRSRPGALGSHRGTRFYPVLILPDGFPIGAVSLGLLRQGVRDAGLLAGGDVAPLEVVDLTELEMLENVGSMPVTTVVMRT
ncbi:MAG: hypothetical protein QOD35_2414, partial [Nocardioidaceae bacterium]|nr:hypothetical protein [Nocardioidaceae bacterium]